MKAIRKFATVLAVLMLAVSMVMMLVACGDDTEDSTPSSTPSSTAASTAASTADSTAGSTADSKPGTGNSTPASTPASTPSSTPSTTPSSTPSSTPSTPGTTPDSTPVTPGKQTVTVNVVDQNGTAIKDATVVIYQNGQEIGEVTTGRSGKGTFEVASGSKGLSAELVGVDSIENMFIKDASIAIPDSTYEVTYVINKYELDVLDDQGFGVNGAWVQICQGEQCYSMPVLTDAEGYAFFSLLASSEPVKIKVLEIESGDYNISDEYTIYGVGSYHETIEIQAKVAYVVTIGDFFGGYLAGAKVALYNERGLKVKTLETDENGTVSFDVDTGSYSVEVTLPSIAYKISQEAINGRYYFEDSTNIFLTYVESDVTYTVKVPDSLLNSYGTVSVYDKNLKEVTYATIEDSTDLTFFLPYEDYIVVYNSYDELYYSPVFFTTDGVTEGTITVTDVKPGTSKDYPIIVTSSKYFYYEEGAALWVYVPFAQGKSYTIYNYGSAVTFIWDENNSDTVPAMTEEGVTVSFDGIANANGYQLFSVSFDTGSDFSLNVSTPGTMDSPYSINDLVGDDVNGGSITGNYNGEATYYEYTAAQNGVLTITTNNMYAVIYSDYKDAEVTDNGYKLVIPVSAGDVVRFNIRGFDNDLYEGVEVNDVQVSFEFGQLNVNYTAYVYKDFEAAQGVEVVLFAFDESFEIVEIAKATTNEDGVAVFENLPYSSKYWAKATVEGYELANGNVEVLMSTEISLYLNKEKDGSVEAPYEFEQGMMGFAQAGIVEIPENTTVWYEIYIPGNTYILSLGDENVVIKIYISDTNDDGVIDENDTPTAVSSAGNGTVMLEFPQTMKYYRVSFSTQNGEAFGGLYSLNEVLPEEGESVDNAIYIEESTEQTVTLEPGKKVYYAYNGDRCKITVTVNGAEATIYEITRSMAGTSENPVGAELVIEDTMYNMIFFAISSDIGGECTLTVTFEAIE